MFNIFRRFNCCISPHRVFGFKCRKCTREILDIKQIAYDELIFKVKEGAILIDVRTKQEFLEGHLEGSILIPYFEIVSKITDMVPDKDNAIIVYCKNGGRSVQAYKLLKKAGYTDVYNLKGGLEGI